jgi:hypothetical protein
MKSSFSRKRESRTTARALRRRRGAGCFCSELTAIDISSSAEILGHRWFGGLKNSEMVLARPLFFAAVVPNPTIASCHRRVPYLHFLRTRGARYTNQQ